MLSQKDKLYRAISLGITRISMDSAAFQKDGHAAPKARPLHKFHSGEVWATRCYERTDLRPWADGGEPKE